MENKKKSNDVLEKHIESIVKPIFEEAAQEVSKNRLSVGQQTLSNKKKCYYQPHNYRLYFDFNKETFSPEPIYENRYKELKQLKTLVFIYNILNSNEHQYKNFIGCTIWVKKTQIEITNLIDHKKWYVVNIGTREEVRNQVFDICNEKDEQCKNVLRKFISLFGGSSNFNILNRMFDHKVMDSNIRKKIPKHMKFRTEVVKKLYNEHNVEYSDPVSAANYMHNMGIEELAPEIHNDLIVIKEAIFGTLKQNESISKLIGEHINLNIQESSSLHEFHKDVKVHNKVLKGIDKSFRRFNSLLSQKKLKEYF